MKKILFFTAALLMAASILPAQSGRLTVWSFTDELDNIINNYFSRARPNIRINYSLTPTEQFTSRLDPLLASGRGVPDVFALESAFVRYYVESGHLLDLTDIYEANKSKLIPYTAEVGTYNGRVYALSWQACPGAFFYRRSLARQYLGTDDPARVQAYFSDINKFMETARLIKEKSNGSCVVVSSRGDLYQPFIYARSQPWIVNGRLVIDPAMERYMDLSKEIHDNDLDGGVGQWSEGWFAGMKGELMNNRRQYLQVLGYFLPTWGLHYVLKSNAPDTSGDWAMIQGPIPYRWGGTWIAAWKDTPNPSAARELIRYITTDENFQERYALDTGDMVSNVTVINKIKNNFREPFLGGQNHYAAFADMAQNVNAKTIHSYDDVIFYLFHDAVTSYVQGYKTKQQALQDFRNNVLIELGINY